MLILNYSLHEYSPAINTFKYNQTKSQAECKTMRVQTSNTLGSGMFYNVKLQATSRFNCLEKKGTDQVEIVCSIRPFTWKRKGNEGKTLKQNI